VDEATPLDRFTLDAYAPPMVRTLDLTPWAGRWVAVDVADHVCCDAPTLATLLDALAPAGLGDVEVMRAPAPDEPVAYGLG
jgi:hypothetical protein